MKLPERHRLTLRAALLEGAAGAEAFAAWSRRVPLDHVDHDEFRLLPLVYLRAAQRGCDAPVMGRLKGVYRQVWVKNTMLLETAAAAVGLLEAAGIATLLLKGIALFARRAGTFGPRAMRDVDILVPRAAARRAIDVLTRSGWSVKDFNMPDFAEVDFEWRHGVTLRRDDGRELDLHWRALPRNTSPAHVETFWADSERVDVMGRTTRILRTEDQLYVCLVHGARHTDGASLDWMVDAFALLRSQPDGMDWSRLTAHARRDRALPVLFRRFRLFREVLGGAAPVAQIAWRGRNSSLDVMASKLLAKRYDFLRPRERLFLDYHDLLVRDARSATPSSVLAFVKERFVVQRTLYGLPKVLIRLFGRPLSAMFGSSLCLRRARCLPAIDSRAPWNAARTPFLFGWSYPEINGRWTNEAQAILGFRDTPDRSTDLLAAAEIRPYLTDRHPSLTVRVIVNGVLCAAWCLSGHDTYLARLTFIVPRAARSRPTRTLLVTFLIEAPARPTEVGRSQDIRTLGFFFERIRFTRPEPDEHGATEPASTASIGDPSPPLRQVTAR